MESSYRFDQLSCGLKWTLQIYICVSQIFFHVYDNNQLYDSDES